MGYCSKYFNLPWECIAKVFRKLYVKYKSNPMKTNGDISKQKNFNQKGTDGTDGKVNRYVSLHLRGSEKKEIPSPCG